MSYSTGTIKIPVLFDMSGDTIVYGEETSGDFVSSHLDFLLDMTTEANDISLNAADISSAILIGDQDTGDNIFYSGGSSGNIAVDNLCNRIAKAITRGKLVHVPKSGDHSNSGIPMGGRANLTNNLGELGSSYAIKYLTSVAPIGDEQMLGQAMARVASIHLVGSPLAAGIFEDQNQIQTDLETASAQTFNSGNTAFYNALAVQLSKVLGGSKSSAPMNPGIIAQGAPINTVYEENFEDQTYTGTLTTAQITSQTGRSGSSTYVLETRDKTVGAPYQLWEQQGYSDVRTISFWQRHRNVGGGEPHPIYIPAIGGGSSYITYGNNSIWVKWPHNNPGMKAYINGQEIVDPYHTFPSNPLMPSNQWNHFCVTFDGNWSGTIRWGHNNAAAGHKENFTHQYIDDVKFYDQTLTASQVAELSAGNEPQGVTITHTPLDASGTSVPALKSIYEQLMNVPGRSQIMETRDISGVVDNSNITLSGGFPFISGDKLVMYLRPKIVFAAQTKAEQNTTLVTASGPVSTTIDVPVYDIGRKSSAGGTISGQVYTESSSHSDSATWAFHKCFEGVYDDDEDWTTAGDGNHIYENGTFRYIGDQVTKNIGETKNITVTTAKIQNNNQLVDTEDIFIYGMGFIHYLNLQVGDTVTYEHPTLGSQTTTISQVLTGGVTSVPYMILLTDPHNVNLGVTVSSCTFHNKKEGLAGEWGQVDIGQNTVINKFQIWPRPSYRNKRSPADFSLLGSLDGTNWNFIKSVSGLVPNDWATSNGNTPAGTNTWELGSVHGPYRYYRLQVKKTVAYGDARLSLNGLLLFGAKSPSEVTTGSTGSVSDISGIQTNIVATPENIEDAFPGNATSGPEPEINKWGWMGSTNSDTLSLETTDVTDSRTCDLHIWKITITL